MTDMKARLQEDRAMRDVAKSLMMNDLEHLRGDMQAKGVASRFTSRMREGAEGLAEDTSQFARENPGRIGSGVGLGISLLFAWLFRDEISSWVEKNWHHVEELAEQITSSDD